MKKRIIIPIILLIGIILLVLQLKGPFTSIKKECFENLLSFHSQKYGYIKDLNLVNIDSTNYITFISPKEQALILIDEITGEEIKIDISRLINSKDGNIKVYKSNFNCNRIMVYDNLKGAIFNAKDIQKNNLYNWKINFSDEIDNATLINEYVLYTLKEQKLTNEKSYINNLESKNPDIINKLKNVSEFLHVDEDYKLYFLRYNNKGLDLVEYNKNNDKIKVIENNVVSAKSFEDQSGIIGVKKNNLGKYVLFILDRNKNKNILEINEDEVPSYSAYSYDGNPLVFFTKRQNEIDKLIMFHDKEKGDIDIILDDVKIKGDIKVSLLDNKDNRPNVLVKYLEEGKEKLGLINVENKKIIDLTNMMS